MAKTPDYKLNEDFSFGPMNDQRTLPAGSFVRPVEDRYVPKHLLDDKTQAHNPKLDWWCYSRYGFLSIPRNKIFRCD